MERIIRLNAVRTSNQSDALKINHQKKFRLPSTLSTQIASICGVILFWILDFRCWIGNCFACLLSVNPSVAIIVQIGITPAAQINIHRRMLYENCFIGRVPETSTAITNTSYCFLSLQRLPEEELLMLICEVLLSSAIFLRMIAIGTCIGKMVKLTHLPGESLLLAESNQYQNQRLDKVAKQQNLYQVIISRIAYLALIVIRFYRIAIALNLDGKSGWNQVKILFKVISSPMGSQFNVNNNRLSRFLLALDCHHLRENYYRYRCKSGFPDSVKIIHLFLAVHQQMQIQTGN